MNEQLNNSVFVCSGICKYQCGFIQRRRIFTAQKLCSLLAVKKIQNKDRSKHCGYFSIINSDMEFEPINTSVNTDNMPDVIYANVNGETSSGMITACIEPFMQCQEEYIKKSASDAAIEQAKRETTIKCAQICMKVRKDREGRIGFNAITDCIEAIEESAADQRLWREAGEEELFVMPDQWNATQLQQRKRRWSIY